MERRVQGCRAGSVGTFVLRGCRGPAAAKEGLSRPGYPWTPSVTLVSAPVPSPSRTVCSVEDSQDLVAPALQPNGTHALARSQLGQGVGPSGRDADELCVVQHDVGRHRCVLGGGGTPFPERLHILLGRIRGPGGLSRRNELHGGRLHPHLRAERNPESSGSHLHDGGRPVEIDDRARMAAMLERQSDFGSDDRCGGDRAAGCACPPAARWRLPTKPVQQGGRPTRGRTLVTVPPGASHRRMRPAPVELGHER